MATSIIKSNIGSNRAIPMTPSSICTPDIYNRLTVKDGIGVLNISALVTTDDVGWKLLFTLDESIGPHTDVYFNLTSVDLSSFGYAYISQNVVYINGRFSNVKVRGSCAWAIGM